MTTRSSHAAAILRRVLNHPGDSTTEDYETAKELIQKYPGLARKSVFEREVDHQLVDALPIFALATKRIGATWIQHMELLELFYDAFPASLECTSIANTLFRTPLHAACRSNLHPRVILYMLEKYPQAAMHKHERGGWPPLTYYLLQRNRNPCKAVVKALVNAAPDTIEFECVDYAKLMPEEEAPTQLEVPAPLLLACSQNCSLEILQLLIPSNPKRPHVKIELSYGHIDQVITTEYADLLAKKVSKWVKVLQVDDRWFTPEGFALFLSTLADESTVALTTIDICVANQRAEVRQALKRLVRQSRNLEKIRVRTKPSRDVGPLDDDALLSALVDGLEHSSTIKSLFLGKFRGRSFADLARVLSTCSSMQSIGFSHVTFTSESVESLIHGIQQSMDLQAVMFDACDMPKGGMSKIVEALADCPTLEVLITNLPQADVVPALAQLSNVTYLHIIPSSDGAYRYKHESASSILDLMETSTNLVRLIVSGLYLSPSRLYHVLQRNGTLTHLEIHSTRIATKTTKAIVKALRDANTTLETAVVKRENGTTVGKSIGEELMYYLILNLLGRAQIMRPELSTINDVVELLGRIDSGPFQGDARLYYGILRECPSLWSKEYSNQVVEENELDQGAQMDWTLENE